MPNGNLPQNINFTNTIIIVCAIIITLLILFNYFKANHIKKHHTHTKQETEKMVNLNKDFPKSKLVLYYTNWCGYSRMFLPDWEKLKDFLKTDDLGKTVILEEYDCDSNVGQTMCAKEKIEGYPSLILFKPNGSKVNFPDNLSRNYDSVISFLKQQQ